MVKWIALGAVAALALLFIFLPVLAWILIGLLLLALAVVLSIPIGADVAYVGAQFSLSARVDGFTRQLFPRKPPDPNKPPEEKKPKKEKKAREEKPGGGEKPKRKLSFTKEELLELAQKALKGLGKFGRITVRKFMLHYTAAGDDPYNTAMIYNFVNAALCTLAPICGATFRVTGDTDVWTNVDFAAEKTRVEFALSLTIRLAQAARAALAVGVGALGVLIRHKLRLRKEARLAKKNGTTQDEPEEQTMIEVEITQAEERKD